MIVVRGRDKGDFETAYFVLRHESEKRVLKDKDLLEEANRIINENQFPGVKRKQPRFRRLWAFLLWLGGFLAGCGGMLLLAQWTK